MKFGTSSALYLNPETGTTDYERMRRLGFSCEDYQRLAVTDGPLYALEEDDFREELHRQKQIANAYGIDFYQAHGPWPVDDTSAEKRNTNMEHFKRSVRGCYYLNCPYLVVHPLMPEGWSREDDSDQAERLNREFILELAAYARQYGVTICIENMPFVFQRLARTKELIRFVRELDLDNVGICLDTGHCNVLGDDPGACARLCGNLLKAVHIHDNFGNGDDHLVPFVGNINWESFRQSLKEIGFEGPLSLECACKRFPAPMRPSMGDLAAKSLCLLDPDNF